ncbi:hypothetical protein IGI37_002465 [Enterococcus sp. AZ194]|uniref:hypothetical protein n=1 Tax=Enterococcus sp. AZ194 TaxID=2774629 RepID=UPI003F22A504
MNEKRRSRHRQSRAKIQILITGLLLIIIVLLLVIIGMNWFHKPNNRISPTANTSNTSQKIEGSSSSMIRQETADSEKSETVENTTEEKYPKITKDLLNGRSWYEGQSSGIKNQPRSGFSENTYHDPKGDSAEYEIIVDDHEMEYKIMEFRVNEVFNIRIKTKISMNVPMIDGTYREQIYYLYYKYDGTLMIAHEDFLSDDYDLISFPLENVINW